MSNFNAICTSAQQKIWEKNTKHQFYWDIKLCKKSASLVANHSDSNFNSKKNNTQTSRLCYHPYNQIHNSHAII